LDLEDIRIFLAARYHIKATKQKRRALEVFSYMDADGDGGLDLSEYSEFCDENSTFVKYTHALQQHMRKCILGIPYWVNKTRLIKKKKATGFARFTSLSNINSADELFTLENLKDPVITRNTKPIITIPWIDPDTIVKVLTKKEIKEEEKRLKNLPPSKRVEVVVVKVVDKKKTLFYKGPFDFAT
jgi:hypothetical protein